MHRLLALWVLVPSAACSGSGSSTGDVPKGAVAPAKAPAEALEGKAEPARVAADAPPFATDFEDTEPGAVPAGVKIVETNGKGTLATWGAVDVEDAPSGKRAFAVTQTTNAGQTYNVALFDGPPRADVELRVNVKPGGTGKEDQGGGVVFRAQGATDYYICRWNPLEKNAKFYIVQGSHRDSLAKAELDLDPAKWHAMRVTVEGSRMELFMNDESVLSVVDDKISEPGAVGLWTKADAATLFDDFSAE